MLRQKINTGELSITCDSLETHPGGVAILVVTYSTDLIRPLDLKTEFITIFVPKVRNAVI